MGSGYICLLKNHQVRIFKDIYSRDGGRMSVISIFVRGVLHSKQRNYIALDVAAQSICEICIFTVYCSLIVVAKIFRTCHEHIVYFADRGVDDPLWEFSIADETNIYVFISQQLDGVHGGVAVYAEFDIWIFPDKILQICKENMFAQRGADTDPYMSDSEIFVIFQIFFAHIQGVKCSVHIFIENLSLLGQGDTSRTSAEKYSTQF